ncbi:MlaD family protein [Aeromicrobium terrae]|uniref:MCE family protein n=1 Tax=Aeromicrobium terrae TaxID=2498846 RepID=A0A5C8NIU9_9ACTN|nr:MlaD family protein [Aeromicrobium terrae]TXL60701.1 MCE family protein [Aeromicrobium terrae]
MKRRGTPKRRRLSTLHWGTIFVGLSLIAGIALFQKQAIITAVKPGDTITVEFTDAHRLRAFVSDAKIAGVDIGVVKSVHRNDDGITEVRLEVEGDSLDAMGKSPSARIRPATLLGGNYYVDIVPGGLRGRFHGTIPHSRTNLPVELDAVAAAMPEGAREGIRSSVSDLDDTLDTKGSKALRKLVSDAPDTLEPATGAMTAMQGTRPKTDLRKLVGGLESTARVLAAKDHQLDGIVTDLASTSSVLAARRDDLRTSTRVMPETLDETIGMMQDLRGTLDNLKRTAGPARDSVQELDDLLENLGPVAEEARPVVASLRTVLTDANPVMKNLVPTTQDLTGTVDNLRGPVLDRVNGPIMKTVKSPWHGTGDYAGGGADRPFYKELAYMVSNLAQANMMDNNGSAISFMPGVGPGSLAGLPISLEQLFTGIAKQGEQR